MMLTTAQQVSFQISGCKSNNKCKIYKVPTRINNYRLTMFYMSREKLSDMQTQEVGLLGTDRQKPVVASHQSHPVLKKDDVSIYHSKILETLRYLQLFYDATLN